MNLATFGRIVEKTLLDNAPTITTAIGVVGTITTSILAAKAGFSSAEKLQRDERIRRVRDLPPATTMEKVKLTWTEYIPPAVVGGITVAAIFSTNRIHRNRAAALAAAYSLSEKTLFEYRQKIAERFNSSQEQAAYDDMKQDRVRKNPNDKEIIISDTGEVLCYDDLTGRYFKSSMENLRKAVNDINQLILNGGYASVSEFYDRIGLEPTAISEELGWTSDNMLEVTYSTVLSKDNRPCISISFRSKPVRDYFRVSNSF